MFKRSNTLAIAVLGVALLGVAFAGTAQAEQCSPDGKICLVTDTSQPLVTPTTLLFRVTSEATHFGGSFSNSRMVQQGPGDTNLWEGDLGTTPTDITMAMEALAYNATVDYRATFAVPLLANAGNLQTKIVRKGKRFVAIFRYEGRTPLLTVVKLLLGINPDVAGHYLKQKGKLVTRPVGSQVIRVVIARNTVKRLCKDYRYCKLGVRTQQYYSYTDEQGQKHLNQITPDFVLNYGTRVVKDIRKKLSLIHI